MTDKTPHRTSIEPAPAFLPGAAELHDAQEVLHNLQVMLMNLGKHRRQDTPEFQQLMGYYKQLGGNIHVVQRQLEQEQAARRKSAAALRPAYRPAQARASESLLNKVKQLRQEQGAAPGRPGPTRPPAVPPARSQTPVPRAGTLGEAWDRRQAQAVPAELRSVPPAELAEEQPAGVAPLALPKFTCTLGPHARPGILSMGEEVACLQQLLVHLGYEVKETEVYDEDTTRAVMAFQERHELPANGVVGVETRKLLNALVTG